MFSATYNSRDMTSSIIMTKVSLNDVITCYDIVKILYIRNCKCRILFTPPTRSEILINFIVVFTIYFFLINCLTTVVNFLDRLIKYKINYILLCLLTMPTIRFFLDNLYFTRDIIYVMCVLRSRK